LGTGLGSGEASVSGVSVVFVGGGWFASAKRSWSMVIRRCVRGGAHGGEAAIMVYLPLISP
jgi:hypothetical protein